MYHLATLVCMYICKRFERIWEFEPRDGRRSHQLEQREVVVLRVRCVARVIDDLLQGCQIFLGITHQTIQKRKKNAK
jgi:hypothetical protein